MSKEPDDDFNKPIDEEIEIDKAPKGIKEFLEREIYKIRNSRSRSIYFLFVLISVIFFCFHIYNSREIPFGHNNFGTYNINGKYITGIGIKCDINAVFFIIIILISFVFINLSSDILDNINKINSINIDEMNSCKNELEKNHRTLIITAIISTVSAMLITFLIKNYEYLTLFLLAINLFISSTIFQESKKLFKKSYYEKNLMTKINEIIPELNYFPQIINDDEMIFNIFSAPIKCKKSNLYMGKIDSHYFQIYENKLSLFFKGGVYVKKEQSSFAKSLVKLREQEIFKGSVLKFAKNYGYKDFFIMTKNFTPEKYLNRWIFIAPTPIENADYINNNFNVFTNNPQDVSSYMTNERFLKLSAFVGSSYMIICRYGLIYILIENFTNLFNRENYLEEIDSYKIYRDSDFIREFVLILT